MAKHPVTLTVNGDEHDLLIEPRKTLLAVLRDTVGLTGTKEGCSTGDCGACTVIVDGKAVTSCMVLGVTASEKEITTIEGLASDGELHPVQQAFIDTGGYQCGFCTRVSSWHRRHLLTRIQTGLKKNSDTHSAEISVAVPDIQRFLKQF